MSTIITHGTITAYNRHKCRCDDCVNTYKTYYKDKAKRKLEKLEKGECPHGLDAYNYGCRCDICVEAKSIHNKKRFTRKAKNQTNNDKEVKHGIYRYNMYKCRCIVCRSAKSEKDAKDTRSKKHKEGNENTEPMIIVEKPSKNIKKRKIKITGEFIKQTVSTPKISDEPKFVIVNESNSGFTIVSGVNQE